MLHAAGVFPFRTHLTSSRLKRGYVEVTVEQACPLFSPGPPARGHVCHTAEILQVLTHITDQRSFRLACPAWTITFSSYLGPPT